MLCIDALCIVAYCNNTTGSDTRSDRGAFFFLNSVTQVVKKFAVFLWKAKVSLLFVQDSANVRYFRTRSVCPPSISTTRRNLRYRGADKSLARPTSRYILFDGENISFYASLAIYIYYIYIYK